MQAPVFLLPSLLISIMVSQREDQKRDIERRFKKKFTGSASDKIIIGFNADPTKRPTIDDLGSSDLTKEDFNQVDNLIQQNIYAGHQITSPMLFGIKTEGQLGGNTELQTAYEIFKNTYANHRQQQLERVIKIIAQINGITAPITFDPLIPITVQEQPNTPGIPVAGEQMTNDAVRNLTGRQHQQLLRIIRQYSKGQLSQLQAGTLLKSSLGISDDEINSLLGTDGPETFGKEYSEDEVVGMFESIGNGRDEFIVLKSKSVKFSTDKECLEDELNTLHQHFYEATKLDAQILTLIQKDKRITPEVIAKALKITPEQAQASIETLSEAGLINTSTNKIGQDTIIERDVTQPVSDVKPIEVKLPEISIKYSYEWNPEVPSSQRDTNAHPSRAFCKKLMQLDKFYSRSEIEQISERLGYSVWDRRGGFWNKGGDISPNCRHIWRSNVLIKKKK
jgi:DNA-binding Lrp family transcriptional regulator